jgi:hypothetical protein
LEKRWLCSAKDSSVWEHRTIRWCTGQCPVMHRIVSGAPGWLWRTRYSRVSSAAYDYKSPDCPVSQRSAAQSARDAWPAQRSEGGTGLSGVPTAPNRQRSAVPKQERNPHRTVSGGAPDCLVRQSTEGKNCLPGMLSTFLAALGL